MADNKIPGGLKILAGMILLITFLAGFLVKDCQTDWIRDGKTLTERQQEEKDER